MSVGAFAASELLCRSLLMHGAVDKGAKEGLSFADYLGHLQEQGSVTPPMAAWVDSIRNNGNESAHRLVHVGQERAESTVWFTAELLRLTWTSIGAYVAATALFGAWLTVARGEWLALVGALMLFVVAAFGSQIAEIEAGPRGVRAKIFQRLAKEVVEVVSPDPGPTEETRRGEATGASEVALPGSAQVIEPLGIPGEERVGRPDIVVTDQTGQAAAFIEVKRLPSSRSEKEFAEQLVSYVRGTGSPGLRSLSAGRIDLERDLFAAILELQTDRRRSGDLGTDDAYERATQSEILRWWTRPELLSDEEVADLAGRVRSLIAHRMARVGKRVGQRDDGGS